MSSSAYPGATVQIPTDDHSTGTGIFVVTWIFTSISAVVVVLKIYTRFKIIHQTGLDDVFTVLALAFLLAFAGIITVSVHRGLGKHFINLSPAALTGAVKLAIISNPLVFLAAAFPNISVAISLDRILVPQLWPRVMLYGFPILQCIVAFICSVITYTQCTPLEALWNPTIPHKCLPSNAIVGILYFNGATSAFTHIFLAVFPIFGLWNIRMKTRTKVGVMLLMSTTSVAAVAAVIRTVYLHDAGLGLDFPYAVHRILNWAIIEAAFIITAACIPSLRPFARALGRSLRLEQAKSLFIPKGYYHSHSRRHRATSLIPRESGSGTTAATRSRHRSGSVEDMECGTMMPQEKKGGSADGTPPSTGQTEKSMEKEAEQAMSHV